MLWRLRRWLRSQATFRVVGRELGTGPDGAADYGKPLRPVAGVTIRRVKSLSTDEATALQAALDEMDIKPPFSLAEAIERLEMGDIFIAGEKEGRFLGWFWATTTMAVHEEIPVELPLKPGHSYIYNLYVHKDFRTGRLSRQLVVEILKVMEEEGITYTWGLQHYTNTAAYKLMVKHGIVDQGECHYTTLFGRTSVVLPEHLRP